MTNTTATTALTQVYRVYIKATPQKIWDAITTPEWSARYGYRARVDFELRPGGKSEQRANEEMKAMGLPDVIIDGEIIEVEPPHRLVQTWRMLTEASGGAEGFTRVSYEIEETVVGTRLTVTHELTGAPQLAAMVSGQGANEGNGGGGWPFILSDLKSLLETGATLRA